MTSIPSIHPAWLIVASIVLGAGATLVLYLAGVSHESYWQMQIPWFKSMNTWGHALDIFWGNITHLGDAGVLLPFIFAACIRSHPSICAATLAALPFGALSFITKTLLAIPRPATVLDHDSFFIVGEPLSGRTSLPSGHTIVFWSVATILLLNLARKNTIAHRIIWSAGFALAATLSLSRVFVGAHWPLDLFFGALFGIATGAIAVLLTERYKARWYWLLRPVHYSWISSICILWGSILCVRAIDTPVLLSASIWLAAIVCAYTSLTLLRVKNIH